MVAITKGDISMFDYRLAQMIYEERLREAEQRRRYRQYAQDAPPLRQRLLEQLGDYLLAVGNKLKGLSGVQAGSVTSVRTSNG
jgi:hypothetical protein